LLTSKLSIAVLDIPGFAGLRSGGRVEGRWLLLALA
jgi:hypothetical protein